MAWPGEQQATDRHGQMAVVSSATQASLEPAGLQCWVLEPLLCDLE